MTNDFFMQPRQMKGEKMIMENRLSKIMWQYAQQGNLMDFVNNFYYEMSNNELREMLVEYAWVTYQYLKLVDAKNGFNKFKEIEMNVVSNLEENAL